MAVSYVTGAGTRITGSVTPTGGARVLFGVMTGDTDLDAPDPGTGDLETTGWAVGGWTKLGTPSQVTFGGAEFQMTVFEKLVPDSPSAGTVGLNSTFMADQEVALHILLEVTDGGGDVPTVVAGTAKYNVPTAGVAASITLDSAPDSASVQVGIFLQIVGLATTYTEGGGYTPLTVPNFANQAFMPALYDESAPGDGIVDLTASRTGAWIGFTVEIELVAGAGVTLTVNSLSHGHTVEAPALTQKNTLSIQGMTHGNALDAVGLTQKNTLAVNGLQHSHSLEAPELTQANVLAPDDLQHGHTLDEVALDQAHTLAVASLAHAHTVEGVALAQANVLAVEALTHAHALEAVELNQSVGLELEGLTHGHTLGQVALVQQNALVVQALQHGHTLASVLLAQKNLLAVDSLQHGHTLDPVALSQAVGLTVEDLAHSHVLDAVQIVQAHLLAVAALRHAHSLEGGLGLVQAGTLTVEGLQHGHQLGAVVIASDGTLVVADLAHAHTLGSVSLTQAQQLVVASLQHAHSLAAVALSSGANLQVADLTHGHTLAGVALLQQSVLAVDGLQHGHTLDAVALSQAHQLVVQALQHGHTLGSPELDANLALAVASLQHGHVLDGLSLAQANTLAVGDLQHSHTLTAVVLSLPGAVVTVSLLYAPEHASALADLQDAGRLVTLVKSTRTENPLTGRTTVATSSVAGYALRVSGDPKEYERLGLVETEAPTFLFVPSTFGDEPELGAETTFAGLTYRVRDIQTVAPDGVGVLYRLVMSLEDADDQPLDLAFGYSDEHRSALADLQAAGAAVTFTERARTEAPTTGVSTIADATIPGYAIRVRGEPDTYSRLGLVAHRSVTLLFVPTTYGLRPSPGAMFDWQSLLHTVREAKPVAPDGAAVVSRIVGVAR